MRPQHVPALVQAYEHARFEVQFDRATIVFRVAAEPLGDVRRVAGRSVTVVTAYNPGQERPSEEVNGRANAYLRAEIFKRQWEHYPAVGYSPDRSHEEPSVAVLDLSEAEARTLGQRYRQACVFYWDGSASRLVWCA